MMAARTVNRADIVIGERARVGVGDISGLVRSIKQIGLLQPVGVTAELTLVFGRRRLAALDELGISDVPVVVLDSATDIVDALRAELDENVERSPFTAVEAAALRRRIKALTEQKRAQSAAAAREERRTAEGTYSAGPAAKPEESAEDIDRTVAEATGVSVSTMQRVERIAHVAAGEGPAAKTATAALASIEAGGPVKPQLDAVLAVDRWPELSALAAAEPARAVTMAAYLDDVAQTGGSDAVEAELAVLSLTSPAVVDSPATRAATKAFELNTELDKLIATLESRNYDAALAEAEEAMTASARATWDGLARRLDGVVASIRAGLNRTGGDDD